MTRNTMEDSMKWFILLLAYFSAYTVLATGDPVPVLVAGEGTTKGFEGQPYAQYREQNAVLTRSGRIVVVAQGRNKSGWSDRSGQDLVSTWSDDHGAPGPRTSWPFRTARSPSCPMPRSTTRRPIASW